MALRPYILGIGGLALSDAEREIFAADPPFGVILFLRNVDNPEQLRALIDEIKTVTNEQTMMFVDQEGGRVQRLAEPYWTNFPIAGALDDLEGEKFEQAVYALYRLISDELVGAQFDVNCAPCLDLRTIYTATFLQDRTFGSHKARVMAAGHASVQAMRDAGIAPVIKHLPGHGRARVDSHKALPIVEFAEDPLLATPEEVAIFQEDFGVDMAMNAHILYPQIDPETPLTLSEKGIEFIRKNVGYKGLLMSDDLAMKALNGTQDALAARAFEAGLDVALSCSGEIADIQAIYSVGADANETVRDVHTKLQDMIANRPPRLTADERATYAQRIGLP